MAIAEDYEAWYHTPRGRWIGDTEFRLLRSVLNAAPGATLLDVGCGTGYFTRRFAGECGLAVLGLDPDADWLAYAATHGVGTERRRCRPPSSCPLGTRFRAPPSACSRTISDLARSSLPRRPASDGHDSTSASAGRSCGGSSDSQRRGAIRGRVAKFLIHVVAANPDAVNPACHARLPRATD
jgi:hypothetical protein